MRTMLIGVVLVCCAVSLLAAQARGEAAGARKAFRIVGYLPDWRIDAWDPAPAAMLTHVMYFSLEPQADGGLDASRFTPEHAARLRQIKADTGAQIIASVGGWKRGTEEFAAMSTDDAARARFVRELTAFVRDNDFDGADFDWEFPRGDEQRAGYDKLIVETKRAFEPHGLELSVAVNVSQTFAPEAIEALDHLFLMVYDERGRHATPEFAERMVRRYLDQGVPPEKIVLGVPFYGRSIENTYGASGKSYAEILRAHPDLPTDQDEVDGLYFNNVETIRRKTEYAVEQGLGGVGMWELTQDVDGERSLLRTMYDAAPQRARQ